mgnify:CR=1 FL=1|jgi:hypothetical protein
MNLNEETYRIKDLMGINLLNEGVTINTEDEWCKANLSGETQICLIQTPSLSGDPRSCILKTGNVARQKGYPNQILVDNESTPNFCKTIWGKITE